MMHKGNDTTSLTYTPTLLISDIIHVGITRNASSDVTYSPDSVRTGVVCMNACMLFVLINKRGWSNT